MIFTNDHICSSELSKVIIFSMLVLSVSTFYCNVSISLHIISLCVSPYKIIKINIIFLDVGNILVLQNSAHSFVHKMFQNELECFLIGEI